MAQDFSRGTTLTYWNGRGRSEVIRIMLAACNEDFTECVPGFPEDIKHLDQKEHIVMSVALLLLPYILLPGMKQGIMSWFYFH